MRISLLVAISGAVLLFALPALAQSPREVHRAKAQERTAQARETAKERIDQIKSEIAARRAEIKQAVCERRQAHLQTVIPHLATRATTLKTVIDKVYERVQGFVASGQLTVSNYDELKAAVDVAQADAAAAVQVVKDYQFELDCENPSVGQQLDGFRQSIRDAHTALKDYRGALVDLISALKAEAAQKAETEATP